MKKLKLSCGRFTLVDDDVFIWASKFYWCLGTKGCVQRSAKPEPETGKRKTIILHRLINKTPSHLHTDHINGKRQDNRRCNLRTVTRSQNHQNSRPQKGSSSKYKGVGWDCCAEKWKAYIKIGNKMKSLGRYVHQIKAARAYNEAAIKYYGEYAWLNKIKDTK